jgi:hypothetical protein
MPKPFSLQAPEDIAKEYGGNKQKIAQAMQTGLVDPTAGTLAGMFIDRMRSAQMQEGAQQPSVAQQVFAPPAPPAPPMGAPPPGAPPMGAPPMGGMPPAPPMGGMGPPPGAPPMGMADGGLAMLPIPESMFDEPMDGEYAGGGIVAFNPGGLTSAPDYSVLQQMLADYGDEAKGREQYEAMYKPKTEASERLRQFYGDAMSEEAQKKRRDEDKYFALAQLGATMAGTPGSLFQSFSAGVGKALPGLQESSRERRAEQRDALKQLAADEGMTNAEQREFAKYMMGRKDKRADLAQNLAQFTSADARARAQLESGERTSAADNAARIRAAQIAAADSKGMQPTYGQLVDLSTQNKNLMKDAIESMAAAEKSGEYADFKAARAQYSSALRNFNQTAKFLGQEAIPSIAVNRFPKMAKLAEQDKKPAPAAGSGGKKPASNLPLFNAADEIVARGG